MVASRASREPGPQSLEETRALPPTPSVARRRSPRLQSPTRAATTTRRTATGSSAMKKRKSSGALAVSSSTRAPSSLARSTTTSKRIKKKNESDCEYYEQEHEQVQVQVQEQEQKRNDEKQREGAGNPLQGRCAWSAKTERSREYHDKHWGHPQRDRDELFEILSLCAQQAGVSWNIVWKKREAYARAFHMWDMKKIAAMTDADVDALVADPDNGIMHNRRKLAAVVNNAQRCIEIENDYPGGLASYLWSFTNNEPIVNREIWTETSKLPTESETSRKLAQALKAKGFKFLGSITLHAFCQQTGIINDHCRQCFKNPLCTDVRR